MPIPESDDIIKRREETLNPIQVGILRKLFADPQSPENNNDIMDRLQRRSQEGFNANLAVPNSKRNVVHPIELAIESGKLDLLKRFMDGPFEIVTPNVTQGAVEKALKKLVASGPDQNVIN